MKKRHFTPAQASEVIPKLELAFEKVFSMQAAIDEITSRNGEEALEDMDDEDHAVMSDMLDRISHQYAMLEALGVIVEVPELGLVDFPSRRMDKEVVLCWRLGESEVGWWHRLGEGLGHRRPIEDPSEFSGD